MACFLVPVGEAIVTTVIQKVVEKKEKKEKKENESEGEQTKRIGFTWGRRLRWLNSMLWGGSVLLAFEHLWHGEIVPWPPFLTAMENPADIAPMLHEMATFGTAMAVTITIIWGIMMLIAQLKARTTGRLKPVSDMGGIQ